MSESISTSNAVDTGMYAWLLFLLFLGLKLAGIITWSWWWVFAPLWIPAGLSLIVIGIVLWAARR